jgi:hypothetical protein
MADALRSQDQQAGSRASLPLWRLGLTTYQGRPVLVSRPQSNQYGHLALEIHLTLSYALEYGADVYFVRDRGAVSRALYEVDSRDVRILRPTAALDMRLGTSLRLFQWSRRRTRWRREMEMSLWKSTREALADYCIDPDVPLEVRNRLRGFRQSLSVR